MTERAAARTTVARAVDGVEAAFLAPAATAGFRAASALDSVARADLRFVGAAAPDFPPRAVTVAALSPRGRFDVSLDDGAVAVLAATAPPGFFATVVRSAFTCEADCFCPLAAAALVDLPVFLVIVAVVRWLVAFRAVLLAAARFFAVLATRFADRPLTAAARFFAPFAARLDFATTAPVSDVAIDWVET